MDIPRDIVEDRFKHVDGHEAHASLHQSPRQQASLAEAIEPDLLMSGKLLARYGALDPGNARLRGVADNLLGADAWKLLWMPPSMPAPGPGPAPTPPS